MKKIIAIIALVIVLSMILPFCVSANRFFQSEIGVVSVKKGSPVIDGNIKSGEGWTGPINFDKTKYGTAYSSHSDYEFSGGLYFASDDKGFYFAAMLNDGFDLHLYNEVHDENGNYYYPTDITFHNGFIESTLDTSSGSDLDVGFDGDVFILQLDPLNWFARNGYVGSEDCTAWYNVTILKGKAAINRTKWNVGSIPESIVSGKRTSYGWTFEAFIPWTEIAKDCVAASGGLFNPSVSQLAAASKGDIYSNGRVNRSNPGQTWTSAEVIYVDRYMDDDSGFNNTWQRYCTMPHDINGIYAEDYGSGVSINHCGIYLQLNGSGGVSVSGFRDVKSTDWFADSVEYVVSKGYFSGMSPTVFAPNGNMTRAMVVSVLHRMAGKPAASSYKTFKDVPVNEWYTPAVMWAASVGVVEGVGSNMFQPNGNVTREQIAAILMRYTLISGHPTTNLKSLSGFKDGNKVSNWAKQAMQWAVAEGIISGDDKKMLNPQGYATRAQVASILMRYDKRIK